MPPKEIIIDISVIVPVGRDDISRCLDSLAAQTFPRDRYEVILVSHRPLTVTAASELVCLTVSGTDPATKRNAGGKAARGDILAFIDDDAWAREDWLATGFHFMEKYPDAGGVGGPRLLPPDSSFQEKVSDVIAHSKFFGNGHLNWPEMELRDKIPHGIINTCNCFIRKSVFDSVGGFNETLALGGEDTEFFFRASHRENHPFAYTWKLVVYHPPRRIGWGPFKQRYSYRVQNGRMLWVHPSIYLSRPTFSIGVFGITIFLIASAIWPIVFPIGLGLYLLLALAETVTYAFYDWRFLFVLPPIFFIHHSVYYFAIMKGFLSIITDYDGIRRLKESTRRSSNLYSQEN